MAWAIFVLRFSASWDAYFEQKGATELGLLSGRALFPPAWSQGWEDQV